MTYTQCKLTHPDGTCMTSWIPTKFAKKNKILKLKDNGVWKDGWVVTSVFGTQDEKIVLARRSDYRNWRDMTDI